MPKRAIVYIDGHNFYHGVVKREPQFKWLDFVQFANVLVRGFSVDRVLYYTARVVDSERDPGQSQRQDRYLRALRATGVTVVEGHFQTKKRTGRLVGTDDLVRVRLREEKGSDVNLAVDLVADALQVGRQHSTAVVLSNDSDLQRAVDVARRAGVEVIIVNPHQRSNPAPSLVGDGVRRIHRWQLRTCQLDDEVNDSSGGVVRRPPEWLPNA